MTCENCFGLITMCIASGAISLYLFRKYYTERNKYSLYMASFFIIDSLGWFIYFYVSFLNIYEFYRPHTIIPVVAAQLILLLFVYSVFNVHKVIRVISVIIVVGIAIIYILIPDLSYLINFTGFTVAILNIILFFMNWIKNEDIKSLGFVNGLIFITIGEVIGYYSLFVEGIFLVIAAAIWLITFSGVLERIIGKLES
ncbi:MAG: hypothetical protein ACFFCM_11690 [Promethearchaeota archaeon]